MAWPDPDFPGFRQNAGFVIQENVDNRIPDVEFFIRPDNIFQISRNSIPYPAFRKTMKFRISDKAHSKV